MADSLLPPGINVGAGRDANDNPVLRDGRTIKLPDGTEFTVTTVLTLRQAEAYAALVLRQIGLIRDAERARGPDLRVVP